MTVLLAVALSVPAQTTGTGAIVVKGKGIKGSDKSRSPLARKRFYLFPGGLKDNQALIDRVKAAEITSRDCFYAQAQASPCYIRWLQQENCESPFCRQVKRDEIIGIKEFEDAYNKGMTLYGKRTELSLNWIVNNMPPNLVSGFYDQQQGLIEKLLAGQKPLQSTMTTSTAVEATFPGIAAVEKAKKFTISNVLPVQIDSKSYVWVCEVDVTQGKNAALPLTLDATKKNCVLTVKDVKKCSTGECAAK